MSVTIEDYKKQKRADTIQIPLPLLEDPSWKKVISPYIYRDYDGEVLLLYNVKGMKLVYNSKLKKWSKILTLHVKIPATLVSVKGMQPEKEER